MQIQSTLLFKDQSHILCTDINNKQDNMKYKFH